ncbi:hypothetical protein [Pedobacter paludis]|nr:hypothetical protein [Pedobacter paludis]
MSDKFVKAFRAASQVPMKDREGRDALGCGGLNVFAKALTFSPSSSS